MPSSDWLWDSNSRPIYYESSPLTTRPGLSVIISNFPCKDNMETGKWMQEAGLKMSTFFYFRNVLIYWTIISKSISVNFYQMPISFEECVAQSIICV